MLYEITAMLMTLIGRLGTSIADQGVLTTETEMKTKTKTETKTQRVPN